MFDFINQTLFETIICDQSINFERRNKNEIVICNQFSIIEFFEIFTRDEIDFEFRFRRRDRFFFSFVISNTCDRVVNNDRIFVFCSRSFSMRKIRVRQFRDKFRRVVYVE